jgi:hypothetical protein
MDETKKKRSLWSRPVLGKEEKIIVLRKFVSQITSDINLWTEKDITKRGGFDFSGRLNYAIDSSNKERYFLTNAKMPILAVSASFDKSDPDFLQILIYPIGKLETKYATLFTYLKSKENVIKKYAMVFFNREDKEVSILIATKELT